MPPDQIIFRYSKTKKTFGFLLAVGVAVAAYILWNTANSTGSYITAFVISIIAVFFLYMTSSEMLSLGKPKLIVSFKGITTNEGTFYGWSEISNERVERTGEHTHALFFTVKAHEPYNVKTDISELTSSPEVIAKIVKQYREALPVL
jgi:hypothetical protein